MLPNSPDPKLINAVRSPLGMGALIVSSLTLVFVAMLATSLPLPFKTAAFAFYVAGLALVGFCTVKITLKNVRILGYGPKELLEQSRLEYEHNFSMRKLELEHQMKKPVPEPTYQQFHDLLDRASTTQLEPNTFTPLPKGKPELSSAQPAEKTSEA